MLTTNCIFFYFNQKKKKKKTLKISRKEIKTRRSLVENNVFYVRESSREKIKLKGMSYFRYYVS